MWFLSSIPWTNFSVIGSSVIDILIDLDLNGPDSRTHYFRIPVVIFCVGICWSTAPAGVIHMQLRHGKAKSQGLCRTSLKKLWLEWRKISVDVCSCCVRKNGVLSYVFTWILNFISDVFHDVRCSNVSAVYRHILTLKNYLISSLWTRRHNRRAVKRGYKIRLVVLNVHSVCMLPV
jgi:hypothetical protein